jgi:hypothetical protein
VSILVVLGLMTGFGLGAAHLVSVMSEVPSVTILPSLAGGMLSGALEWSATRKVVSRNHPLRCNVGIQ